MLGPCLYPAGHFLHYVPAFLLHYHYENAHLIMKFVHVIVHSVLILFLTKISCLYFGEAKKKSDQPKVLKMPPKAQLICFILLSNQQVRKLFSTMQNDEIMMMYMVISVYLFARNKPLQASFFFTLGYSLKAALILLMPAFLGCMMHTFGTI
jgi:Gpi18-like mannosyltransferase